MTLATRNLTPLSRFRILRGMALLKDLTLPDPLKEELANLVRRLPSESLITLARLDKTFAQGFRAVPQNIEKFRKRMVTLVESPDPVPPSVFESLRQNSFQQQFTCVMSSLALIEGYTSLAVFIGEARLLLSMLLDPRDSVVEKAQDVIQSRKPIAPPPASPEDARKAMADMFGPFLREFTTILFAPAKPSEKVVAVEVESIKVLMRKLEEEKKSATSQATSLESKLQKLQSRLTATEKEYSDSKILFDANAKCLNAEKLALTQLQSEKQKLEQEKQTLSQALDDEESRSVAASESLRTLHANFSKISEENTNLKRELEALKLATVTRRQEERISVKAEFQKTLIETVPLKTLHRTARDRLADLTLATIKADEILIFLIDGHNILNLLQPYASARDSGATHEEQRKALLKDIALIQSKLGDCEMRLFFDGPTASETTAFGNKDLKIIYSGGTGDHRADRRIVGYIEFARQQTNRSKIITVTEDQDLRKEAATCGSLLLYPREFMTL